MKTTTALLSIEVYVSCPHCEFYIDVLDEDDTDGYDHNEEGFVLTQACPDGHWIDEHKKFEIKNVKCSQCKNVFNIKELEW